MDNSIMDVVLRTVVSVQRPSRRLHGRRLFHPLNGTEHGYPPSFTTSDKELVSDLEVGIEPGDLNPRRLTPQSVTLLILPRAGFFAWSSVGTPVRT